MIKISCDLFKVLFVVLLLGAYALIALYSIVNKAATADEGIHLVGGWTYWEYNDYRMQPENGNLPQRWAAIPLQFQALNTMGLQNAAGRSGNVWEYEWLFFYKVGNEPLWMFFTARSMIILASVLIGAILFFYAKSLWGYAGAGLTLTLYCLSPDVLAHGRLVTSDIIGAGAFIAAIWSLYTLLKGISPSRVLVAGLSFGILAVAKYSAILMVPIVVIGIGAHLLVCGATRVSWGARVASLDGFFRRLSVITLTFFTVGLVAWGVLWSFYGFRYEAFNDAHPESRFLKSWEQVRPASPLIAWGIECAQDTQLLPEAYIYGFSHVIKHSEYRHAFLAGDYSRTGWWYFFPFTFAVKSPVAFLAFLLFAAALCGNRLLQLKRSGQLTLPNELPRWFFPTVLILVYGVAALTTTLNIGHRHILPIYLSLFLLLGGVWKFVWLRGWPTRIFGIVLVLGYAYESLRVYPHFLTFFNRLSGGPEAGHLLLVDSSLDWGQDLYALDDWLKEHNSGPDSKTVTLSYFGRSSPGYLGMDLRYMLSRGVFKREAYNISTLQPGLFVMSATMLQGMYSPDLRPWTSQHESTYRFLLSEFKRLADLAPDQDAMLELIQREGSTKWANLINHFVSYRAERIRIHLLSLEPEVVLNNTMFLYNISEEELNRMVLDPAVGFPDDFPTHDFSLRHSSTIE